MKTIIVAGPSGLLGRAVIRQLKDYTIMTAGRNEFGMKDKDFVRKYEKADVILNFSGSPILKRWTKKNRREIMESRVDTTRKLGLIVREGMKKKRHYLSASAIGIYSDDGIHGETSPHTDSGFLNEVVERWECEAMKLSGEQTIVSLLRIGIVLSRDGGMLRKIMPVFRKGLGGSIGDGQQAFSWIHIEDLTGATAHIIEKGSGGIYNMVSPGHCRNIDFTRELANALGRKARFRIPAWGLKILYGKSGKIAAGGKAVIPERLLKENYLFRFPDLAGALHDIVN